jgi:hypothetical protein
MGVKTNAFLVAVCAFPPSSLLLSVLLSLRLLLLLVAGTGG